MSTTNLGNSRGLYVFKTPLDSDYLDSMMQTTLPLGVYSGLNISIVNNATVTVNIGTYAISDGVYTSIWEVQSPFNLAVSNSTPYVIARWIYQKTLGWYADYYAVSYTNIQINDVVIGKCMYNNLGTGTTLQSISYNKRTTPDKLTYEALYNNLKVVENPFGYMSVLVKSGFITLNDGFNHTYNQTVLSIATADPTYDRIDVVVVDSSGNLTVLIGTPSVSPVAASSAGLFGLAQVYVNAGITTIYQENITDVRSFFTVPFNVGDISLYYYPIPYINNLQKTDNTINTSDSLGRFFDNDLTTSKNIIDFYTLNCLDDTYLYPMICSSINKNINLPWVSGNNNGGIFNMVIPDYPNQTALNIDNSNVGTHNSIATDLSNYVYMSYYDTVNSHLKYITNKTGSWISTTVDSTTANVGLFNSIAMDSSGFAYISYFDSINGHLKYATNKTGSWVLTTVDTGTNVGQYTSISVDSSGFAYISYNDVGNNQLKYATNKTGSWVATTIDSSANVGSYTSIKLDASGFAYISYWCYNTGSNALKYATNKTGSWVLTTVDTGTNVGQYTSISVDSSGFAYISYYGNNQLKYATNKTGSWVLTTVDTGTNVGQNTGIVLDSNKFAYISYIDGTNSLLKYATNKTGSWVITTLESNVSVVLNTGAVGINIDIANYIHISYYSNTSLNYITTTYINTILYCFELLKNDLVTTDAMISNQINPSLPTHYIAKRYVGSKFTTNTKALTNLNYFNIPNTKSKNHIDNLIIENTPTILTVKAGLEIVVKNKLCVFGVDTVLTPTTIGGGGFTWGAIVINELTGVLSTISFNDITSDGNGNTYTYSPSTNQLNMYNGLYDNNRGYCACTTINGTFRIVAIYKQITGFTDTSAATVAISGATGYEINITSSTKYTIGMKISESGNTHIPANSQITEITNSTQIRMNNIASNTGSSISMVVANDIINITILESEPRTCISIYNNLTQFVNSLTPITLTNIMIDINSEFSGLPSSPIFTSVKISKIRFDINNNGSTTPFFCMYIYELKNGIIRFQNSNYTPNIGGNSIINLLFYGYETVRKNDILQFDINYGSNGFFLNQQNVPYGTILNITEI